MKILYALGPLVLLAIGAGVFAFPISAQEITSSVTPSGLDENTPTATVTFRGLVEGKQYRVNLHAKLNVDDILNENDFTMTAQTLSDGGVGITVEVCGGGEASGITDLRLGQWNLKRDCNTGVNGDFFHGGFNYKVRLYDGNRDIARATFIPTRWIPNFEFVTESGTEKPTPSDTYRITVKGQRRAYNDQYRNNYHIAIKAPNGTSTGDEKGSDCITVRTAEGANAKRFGPYAAGSYRLIISEQNREGTSGGLNSCNAGFKYYWQDFTITPGGGEVKAGVKDPENKNDPSRESKDIPPPCDVAGASCETFVGKVDATPTGFVGTILRIGLAMAGILAIFLFLYGGFKIITSQGNAEAVATGRALITSAIAGILFILGSVFLLGLFAGEILRLPGFTPAQQTQSNPNNRQAQMNEALKVCNDTSIFPTPSSRTQCRKQVEADFRNQ